MFRTLSFANNFISQFQKKSSLIKFLFSNKKMVEPAPIESQPAAKKEKELPVGTLEDFAKIDIRVGEIKECWKVSSFFCECFCKLMTSSILNQISFTARKLTSGPKSGKSHLVFRKMCPSMI